MLLQLRFDIAVRLLQLLLLIFVFENTLEADTRLNVHNLNLTGIRCDIRLPLPLILPDRRTIDLLMLKDALVKDHELAVQTRVDLQILCRLHEYCTKELVVEGVDRQACIDHVIMVADIILPNLLRIVCNETVAINPDQLRRDRN